MSRLLATDPAQGMDAEVTVPLSDRKLLGAARRGSAEAVDTLIDRHWDRANRIAYGILGDAHAAEDVTQEAMLSIVRNLGRFDPYRPFQPWLHRIVTNKALDWTRARARRPEIVVDPLGDSPRTGQIAGDELSQGEEGDRLREALAALTPDYRAVIVLRFVAGYGPKETAQLLGIPAGTVSSRLNRALEQMRKQLEVSDE
ncbi:MAG TPA: RNA polymerase sigma factor [Solirubrobacterales bacterium]|nr:RNA polymerase sigma factor [Solirubrobacterales bacterium]